MIYYPKVPIHKCIFLDIARCIVLPDSAYTLGHTATAYNIWTPIQPIICGVNSIYPIIDTERRDGSDRWWRGKDLKTGRWEKMSDYLPIESHTAATASQNEPTDHVPHAAFNTATHNNISSDTGGHCARQILIATSPQKCSPQTRNRQPIRIMCGSIRSTIKVRK